MRLSSCSPRLRLSFFVLGLVLCLTLPTFGLMVLALVFVSLLLMLGGTPILKRLLALALFTFLGLLPIMLTTQSASSIWHVGPWGIDSTSLHQVLHIGLRVLSTSSFVWLMLIITPIYQLCRELRMAGVPRLLVELFELTYRYLYLLIETAQQILEAQQARLGYRNIRAKISDGGLLLGQTFVLAHSHAQSMYEGLQTRHYEGGTEQAENNSSSHSTLSPSNSTPLLCINNICFTYPNGSRGLDALTLTIHAGERIALLGANGAGKSTLMRLLVGLLREQSGSITLNGQQLNHSSSSLLYRRKHIALVMQQASYQLFCPSVEEEIAFGLRNIGLTPSQVSERTEAIITAYDLQPLRHKAPHELSEGQRKWVSLAAVLALEPSVILLDEPTAALDAIYTERVLTLLEELSHQGRTIILSTHDPQLAYRWAERACVLADGYLAYDGALETLYAQSDTAKSLHIALPIGFNPYPSGVRESQQSCRLALYHSPELNALIIGGGRAAERKARTLVDRGIRPTIVAPELTSGLDEMTKVGQLVWQAKHYAPRTDSLTGYQLIVAATGIVELDRNICLEARRQGLMVASASEPEWGTVEFAAQGSSQGIDLAVHTAWRLPELSQTLRTHYLNQMPTNWGEQLERLSTLRESARLGDTDAKAQYQALKDLLLDELNHL